MFLLETDSMKLLTTISGEVGGIKEDEPESGSSGLRVSKGEHDTSKIKIIYIVKYLKFQSFLQMLWK